MVESKNTNRAFSHKVRTGCIICKRRRVKCDEGKPECIKCVNRGQACSYDIPKANIFEIEPQNQPADKTLTLAKNNYPSTPPSSSSNASTFSPGSRSSSSSSDDEEMTLSLLFRPHYGFGTKEECRSLNHWLLRTSPMLSHYGPMGDFFTIVVPQLAWSSSSIRHMLVSLSMTHEKFMKGVADWPTESQTRALSHYVSAITELRTNPPPQVHVLATALLAWTMEMMQNNVPAALVHLKASQSLLRQSMLAQGLTAIVLRKGLPMGEVEPEYHDHLGVPCVGPRFASIAEARQAICEHIEKIASLLQSCCSDDTALQDMQVAVSTWFESIRKWDKEMVPTPALIGLTLLFNIAMALFPSRDVAGYSYSVNPTTIDFVVEKASLLLDVTRSSAEDRADALESLIPALGFVVRFFPDASSHGQALQLLRQIETSESHQAERVLTLG
ncbi:transcription factor [Elasticomyces elasticus]|nr:transcription factor [Elasticomyces elasticus]KAK5025362.1 hypothetical protein LTS07_008213 [Exophiala sideris]KAK5032937.1 transcription factor [Exophiala sideris]KAK5180745.1 hypothetical protein LTR44_007059 [Eurotiomycetes sp. CCFEE 6388]